MPFDNTPIFPEPLELFDPTIQKMRKLLGPNGERWTRGHWITNAYGYTQRCVVQALMESIGNSRLEVIERHPVYLHMNQFAQQHGYSSPMGLNDRSDFCRIRNMMDFAERQMLNERCGISFVA